MAVIRNSFRPCVQINSWNIFCMVMGSAPRKRALVRQQCAGVLSDHGVLVQVINGLRVIQAIRAYQAIYVAVCALLSQYTLWARCVDELSAPKSKSWITPRNEV